MKDRVVRDENSILAAPARFLELQMVRELATQACPRSDEPEVIPGMRELGSTGE
jgi:hypothetical protein